MTDADLAFLSAAELAGRIRAGDVAPGEAVENVLARIEASQGTLNAFITVCAAEARAAAREAEAALARGGEIGPLHGVPVSVKDIINTAGVATTFGSLLMTDNVPAEDAVAVRRLKRAGAIVIGKTTTPEQAHKLLTDAKLFGVTRNPWDLDLTPGGSSGGSAAAVAAGLGPLSLATDAGASTRLPAACVGIVGMKPTLGVAPHNQLPEAFANFIHLGVFARTVSDAALMLGVLSGEHRSDPYSMGRPAAAFALGQDLQGVRIAWRPLLGNSLLAGDVRAACEDALRLFEEIGARVVSVEDEVDNAEPTWRILQQSNWAVRFAQDAEDNAEAMDPSLVEGVRAGLAYSGRDVQRAMYRRTRIFRDVQAWFDDCDLVLTPTIARTPLAADHKALDPIEIDGADAGDMRQSWCPYLNLFNLTGNPVLPRRPGLVR